MILAKLRNIMDIFLKKVVYLLTIKILPVIHKTFRFLLHKQKKIELFLLILFTLLTLLNGVKLFDKIFEQHIGYADTMANIHNFDRILDGQIPFKDFYRSKGPLLLYLEAPLYKMFGKNHFAFFFVLYSLLPAISLILLYFWAKIFLKSPFFPIAFLIAASLQNLFWAGGPTLRILAAAFALGLFLLARQRLRKRYFYLSGFLCGCSLLISLEFGIAALLTIMLLLISEGLMRKFPFKFSFLWILGIVSIILPFSIFFHYQEALIPYLRYTLKLMHLLATGYAKPFPFPREDFRFYLPPLLYFFSFLLVIFTIKRKGWEEFRRSLLALTIFGLLLYKRPFSMPDFAYLLTAILPATTICFILIERTSLGIRGYLSHKKIGRLSLSLLFIFILLFGIYTTKEKLPVYNLLEIYQLANPKFWVSEHKDLLFYDRVGYFVSQEAAEEYDRIIEYIQLHTNKDDFIYVFPWGPYNHFTGRPSPVKVEVLLTNMADPEYYNRETVEKLEKTKPKYIILNLYNNLGMVGWNKRGDVHDYIGWKTEDSPAFYIGMEEEPIVEKYILENYHTEVKFRYAAIMVRNEKKREYRRYFEKVFSKGKFQVERRYPNILIETGKIVEATHLELKYKMDIPKLMKFFNHKYFVRLKIFFFPGGEQSESVGNLNLSADSNFHTLRLGFGGLHKKTDKIQLSLEAPGAFNCLPKTLEVEYLNLLYVKED